MNVYSIARIPIALIFSKFIIYELSKFIMKNHIYQLQTALEYLGYSFPLALKII